MEYTEPTEAEIEHVINTTDFGNDRDYCRQYAINLQLREYIVKIIFYDRCFILHAGNVLFIDIKQGDSSCYVFLKDRKYYTFLNDRFISIPVIYNKAENYFKLPYYFVPLPEVGNAIYMKDRLSGSFHVIVYFDEKISELQRGDIIIMGQQIVNIFMADGEVIAIDSLGNIVPCHFIVSTVINEDCATVFSNTKLEILIYTSLKGEHSAVFKSKTGSNTKAAR